MDMMTIDQKVKQLIRYQTYIRIKTSLYFFRQIQNYEDKKYKKYNNHNYEQNYPR